MSRIRIACLMILVGLLALGLGAMRDASALATRISFTVLLVMLFVGLLGALVRRGDGAWTGFALFGWGYALLVFVPAVDAVVGLRLLTTDWVGRLADELLGPEGPYPQPPPLNKQFLFMIGELANVQSDFETRWGRLLSASEKQALASYIDQRDNWISLVRDRRDRLANAINIGHCLLALTFASAGAVLGRFLERGHVRAAPPSPTRNGPERMPS